MANAMEVPCGEFLLGLAAGRRRKRDRDAFISERRRSPGRNEWSAEDALFSGLRRAAGYPESDGLRVYVYDIRYVVNFGTAFEQLQGGVPSLLMYAFLHLFFAVAFDQEFLVI